MNRNRLLAAAFAWLLLSTSFLQAQKPKQPNSAEILHMLEKLNVLGSALYVAAHPDDENTQMITYLANEKKFNTAYLSATRGDGGQNLIGPEIREQLGLIRTQELLAARRTDGGKQYFSRANDFGYSKNPEETLEIWDEEEVLKDFVRIFRKHKPDIIITRFPENGLGGHGHHTASAILAGQAFELAADEKSFPSLVKQYGTWQAKSLFFNTHPWFFRRAGMEMDTSKYFKIDLGTFNPLLGKSYSEISAESRSMHKSQGFGVTGTRGIDMEYFEFMYGERPQKDMFDGIDTTWGRVKGGEKVGYHVDNALLAYDPKQPWVITNDLVKAYDALQGIEDEYWKEIKSQEIKNLIKAVTGLYLEIKTDDYSYVPGDSIMVSVEAINRSKANLRLEQIEIAGLESFEVKQLMRNNRTIFYDKSYKLSSNLEYTAPYWLKEEGTFGMYAVKDENQIGQPENAPAIQATFILSAGEVEIDFDVPLVFKRNDPVDGEVYRPVQIAPPVFVNISEAAYIFGNGSAKQVEVIITAGKDNIQGSVKPIVPRGWQVQPASIDFELSTKEEEKAVSFTVSPPDVQSVGEFNVNAEIDSEIYDQGLVLIDYDHFPMQTLFPKASAQLVKVELEKRGNLVGYIAGAGDEIPASLRQVGYEVVELDIDNLANEKLESLDAIILGVRAFNTQDKLKFLKDDLMTYVEQGGTVIVQYNTAHRLVTEDFSPYRIKLSRDRVSVEEAEVRMLLPDHQVLNEPNKITSKDFENWVQERGLYFPSEWDDNYDAILSSNDPNEDPKDGGLLVTQYGEGYYIYSGYSWFRQLPAGVPGAYRLFTNMISIGKSQTNP